MLNNHIQNLEQFYNEVKAVSLEYQKSKEKYKTLGFNVFSIASNRYYLEDFHSDIIKAFLDPNEKHGEGNLFLEQFLKLIGVNDFEPYKDAIVTREKHKIDILIKSKSDKRAIIIENKINNAPDTNNQIPNYYETIIGQEYIVEKIIYIPLDNDKAPDETTWKGNNLSEVRKLLKIMPAVPDASDEITPIQRIYDSSSADTVSDVSRKISLTQWLEKCIMLSNMMDNISILRQYYELIKFLRGEIMDYKALEQFHAVLLKGDNLKTATSSVNMLKELPTYLAFKIHNKYKENYSPFLHIKIWKEQNGVIFKGYKNFENSFNLEIYCSVEKYVVVFKEETGKPDYFIKKAFQSIEILDDLLSENSKNYSMEKTFSFHDGAGEANIADKTGLYYFIDTLLSELQKMKS